MRKVFLDNLYKDNQKINWLKNIGSKVKFIYGEIEDSFIISGYDKRKIIITYNNKEFKISSDGIRKCKLGKILGKKSGEFEYDIGDIINNIRIVDKLRQEKYRTNRNVEMEKRYIYKCLECSYEGNVSESNLKRGCGCAYCSGNVTILGKNTIYDTDKWMIDLGIPVETAKLYKRSSGKKVEVICPCCGNKKNLKINNIYKNKSIGCICSDGYSYPEKLMYSLLSQLDIEFATQLSKGEFSWCGEYKYDFYIPSLSCIIETHGIQHYEETSRGRSLEEEQENDRVKRELALVNNITNYIELDCRYSDLEYIKDKLLNSELNKLIKLDEVNWNECEEFAIRNVIKEICDCWNNRSKGETTKDIADRFNIARSTINKYLHKGNELGLCKYDGKLERINNCSKIAGANKRKVEMFLGDISLGVFDSACHIERDSERMFGVKLSNATISLVCKGHRKHHHGYVFRYIEEDNQQIAS